MPDKSYVSLEQNVCMTCGKTFDTGAIIMDRMLRPKFDMHTVTDRGICPECKEMVDNGQLALVEVSNTESDGPNLKPSQARPTGRMLWVMREPFERMVGREIPSPLAYVDVPAFESVLKQAEEQNE